MLRLALASRKCERNNRKWWRDNVTRSTGMKLEHSLRLCHLRRGQPPWEYHDSWDRSVSRCTRIGMSFLELAELLCNYGFHPYHGYHGSLFPLRTLTFGHSKGTTGRLLVNNSACGSS